MGNIKLRPLKMKEDLSYLYGCMLSADQYLFSTKMHFNTIYQFDRWLTSQLENSFHDFYMCEYEGAVVGYVHNYDFVLTDGRCRISVYIHSEFRDLGIGGLAAIRFMDILFKMYSLRKIYLDIYDYNEQSLQSNLKAGFIEEGIIPGYRYYDNEFHDMHILSIKKDIFYNRLGKFL